MNRETLRRWMKEPGWEALSPAPPETDEPLEELVNKAMTVLDRSLEGEPVKPHQIRAAIEVVKASNAFKKASSSKESSQNLLDILVRLDSESKAVESD